MSLRGAGGRYRSKPGAEQETWWNRLLTYGLFIVLSSYGRAAGHPYTYRIDTEGRIVRIHNRTGTAEGWVDRQWVKGNVTE